eukprot:TRINITY_DN2147_c0_g1_i1.p1 TRINITY_DN2147_c0_g1~~TRINITY_DN2147_c0_g1_i1.p1  ORF type:complete len:935 (+),score=279.37 TRINITY_DN2147_c0_g1_i1:318-3122(+)
MLNNRWKGILLSVSFFFLHCQAINEPTTDNIAIGLTGKCLERQSTSPCVNLAGQPLTNQPEGFPCPCITGDKSTSAFPGTGKVQDVSDPVGSFNDQILVSGSSKNVQDFYSITGMAFTDNTQELFVVAKAGQVFRYDLVLGTLTTWLDISNDVHNAGDKGLLSIETHPDFANNPYVFLSYAVKAIAGPNNDMNAISYTKVIRVTDMSGNGDPSSIVLLLGQSKDDSNPLCGTSHMGGAMGFGHDGSLFVTLGEGSHFDTDIMDFGQAMPDRYPYDADCLAQFGEKQAIGSLRAQSLDTLGGKLIRIDPTTGNGICSGDWKVYNPYCDGDDRSTRSRIWSMGLRNPYSMNVKPLAEGGTADEPGVVYIGDVGLGSFEEINVASASGMNFGWPCWEGPQPMGGYRDSNLNDLTNTGIRRPYTDNGEAFSCPYVYENVVTTHPTFYYSRYDETTSWSGIYGEEYIMGAGFVGNCIGGVSFYTGDSYPEIFKNRVFILDYGALWIKTLQMEGDQYQSIHSFKDGIDTPVVSLEVNPNTGDICYIAILAGEVHCISYDIISPPPIVQISANVTVGSVGMTVQFSSDGSFQRDNNRTDWIAWDFRDGSATVIEPNPIHTFETNGTFPVTVVVSSGGYNVSKSIMIKVNGQTSPTATILEPIVDEQGFLGYVQGGNISFIGIGEGGSGGYSYYWDTWLVHSNHYHPQSAQTYEAEWSADANALGANSHAGLRINFLTFLTVTDSEGNSGTSFIRLRESDWESAYGNANPVASFAVSGFQPYETGQFVRVDASATFDTDLDYIIYKWDFGDGTIINFDPKNARMVNSHAYKEPGTYSITLTAQDNWGGEDVATATITVISGFVQEPPSIEAISFPDPEPTETTQDSTSTQSSAESTTEVETSLQDDVSASEPFVPQEETTETSAATQSGFALLLVLAAILIV